MIDILFFQPYPNMNLTKKIFHLEFEYHEIYMVKSDADFLKYIEYMIQ